MIGFMQYLLDQGYTPYRSIKGELVEEQERPISFSTLNNKIDVRLRKGDREFIFGIADAGYPPTLIHPLRSRIDKTKSYAERHTWDNFLSSSTFMYLIDQQ